MRRDTRGRGRTVTDSQAWDGDGRSAAPAPTGLRASDRERDDVVARLQIAFADGRIDAEEFDTRVRGVLDSRTRGELVVFTADLPSSYEGPGAVTGLGTGPGANTSGALAPTSPASLAPAGRLSLAYKTSLRRGGRWRVPHVFTAVSYKGGGTVIDLRSAEFTSPHTTIRAIAYKCRVTVYVAPGTRVALSGIGVSDTSAPDFGDAAELAGAGGAAATGPSIRIRGLAYKGVVEIRTVPPSGSPDSAAPAELPR